MSQIWAWHQDMLTDWLTDRQSQCDFDLDRLCGLLVRVTGYRTKMYCASCEVRTECIYVMYKKVDLLCGLVVRVNDYRTEMYFVSCEVRTECTYVM
jgi:hypothetical protein